MTLILSLLNKFQRSNFWSGWFLGIAGYFIAASLSRPDDEWLYVGMLVCLLAGWLLKERPSEGIRNTGNKAGGSSSVLSDSWPDVPEGKTRFWT